MMMKKLLLIGVGLAALLATPAMSADLGTYRPTYRPAPVVEAAPVTWTGFYVGAHVGAGWSTTEWTLLNVPGAPPIPLGSLDSVSGFLGGLQIGANYQVDVMVFGVEADFSWAGLSGQTCAALQDLVECNTKADRFGTLTGRFGIAADHALFYLKGGGAWVHDTFEINTIGPIAQPSVSDNRRGWTAGGGVEYALPRNWSAKLEYDFMDFGTSRYTFNLLPTALGVVDTDVKQRIQVVKFGLNYRFGYDSYYAPAVYK
jgi:outer membrane immunogenic protein